MTELALRTENGPMATHAPAPDKAMRDARAQESARLDVVELASRDSFPASDPPAWIHSSR
jgi:hypothetical protein